MTDRRGLELRSASAADAAGLASLMHEASLPVDAITLATRIDAIRTEHGTVLLALDWGPPSGVIVLSWGWTLQAEARSANISLLLVDPAARRRGVGRLLVKAAAQAARAAGCAELQVANDPDASELVAFCMATGFIRQGASLSRPLRRRASR